jgi:hypothetical protein
MLYFYNFFRDMRDILHVYSMCVIFKGEMVFSKFPYYYYTTIYDNMTVNIKNLLILRLIFTDTLL